LQISKKNPAKAGFYSLLVVVMLVFRIEFIKLFCRDGFVNWVYLCFDPLQHFVCALVLIGLFYKSPVLHHLIYIIFHPGLVIALWQTAEIGK